MGYTHYWSYSPNDPAFLEGFARLLVDAQKIVSSCAERGIYVTGRDGEGITPGINEGEIFLNGCNAEGDDPDDEFEYEDLYINPWTDDGRFSFCKTARRPYDLVVTAILLRAAQTCPTFEISSDGSWDDNSEWGPARELVQALFNDNSQPKWR